MITWRRSSHSGSGGTGGQECVELAQLDTAVGVRDSKSPESGYLALEREQFAALVARVKSGLLDT